MDKMIILFLVLTTSIVFGQKVKGTKRDKEINSIIGTWVFKDGESKDKEFGKIKIDQWHTDTIYFFSNMTIRFYKYLTGHKDPRKNTGSWDISENGKNLILKGRQITPPVDELLPDVQLPIRLTSNQLTIIYPLTIRPNPNDKSNLNKESSVTINFVRLK